MRRPISSTVAWALTLAGVGAAGLALAQPTPPVAPPAPVAPVAPVAEEAPPATVATPTLIPAPPISEKEIEPAPPPKAQVEEKTVVAPTRRARFDVAVLQALDKVTAESIRFEAAVGRPIRYKSLVFTVKACERAAPDEAIDDSIAYLTIDSQPRPAPGKPIPPARQAFKGWMYASSPGLNPLQHSVYDVWLITCRAAAPLNAPVVTPRSPLAAPAAKSAPTAPISPPAAATVKVPPPTPPPPPPKPVPPVPPPAAEPEAPPT